MNNQTKNSYIKFAVTGKKWVDNNNGRLKNNAQLFNLKNPKAKEYPITLGIRIASKNVIGEVRRTW